VVREGKGSEIFVGTIVKGRREGPAHLYDLSGLWDQVGAYRAGVKHGPWDSFRGGLPESRCDWVDGRKTGVCVLFDACGGEVGREQFVADVLDGPSLQLHGNGLKAKEATYSHGQPTGAFRTWHLNGVPSEEGLYDGAGQKVGLWRKWFDNGQLAAEEGEAPDGQRVDRTWFRNGVHERETLGEVSRTWLPTGAIASERNVRPGVSTEYFAAGGKKSETVGAVTTFWYANGQVFMRVERGPRGEVASLERWDEAGAPISDEEWARQNAQRAERWRVLGKALEIPASLLLYGLK
jgi:hypothetical protein